MPANWEAFMKIDRTLNQEPVMPMRRGWSQCLERSQFARTPVHSRRLVSLYYRFCLNSIRTDTI